MKSNFLQFWSVNYTIFHTITQKFIFCVLLFITNNIYVHKEKNGQNNIFQNYHRSRNTLPPEKYFYFWKKNFTKIIINKS